MDLKNRLEAIEKENNKLVQEKNRIEGRLDALKQQLIEKFKTDDVSELRLELERLKKESESMKAEIEVSIEKMEAQIGISN